VESHTRRGIVIAALIFATVASVGRLEQPGTFALLGGTPKIVSEFWAEHGTGLTATLKIRQFQPNGTTPILTYDVDMQHLMHLIVVRDDFATFAHLHPAFDTTTGTFSQRFTKQPNHKYYVYADTTPHGIGHQVFRFTIERDGPQAALTPSSAASSADVKAGPYVVILAKTTLKANTPQKLDLSVVKGDDPAPDLAPYLGAPAHVVLIDTKTLQYAHVHPMLRGQTMSPDHKIMNPVIGTTHAGPFMQLMLPALPAGIYKTWVQIAGGPKLTVYTAPFTLAVQ